MSYYFHDFSKITVAQKHAGFQLLSFRLIHRPHCIKDSRSIRRLHSIILFHILTRIKHEVWAGSCIPALPAAALTMCAYFPRPPFSPEEVSSKVFSWQIYYLSRFRDYLLDSLALLLIPVTQKSSAFGFKGHTQRDSHARTTHTPAVAQG